MESVWGEDVGNLVLSNGLTKINCMFNTSFNLCLGRNIAYMKMKYMVANILEHYKVNVIFGHPTKLKFGVILFMKYGLSSNPLFQRRYYRMIKRL